jgi:uncharacterized protein with GYD domain
MSSYLVLIQFTDQGIRNIKDSPKRAAAAAAAAKKFGVKVREQFWTLGPYDGALVLEAPDDETVTAWALNLGSLGNVKTQTMRALGAKEFATAIAKISAS